ncbi:RDD family protein [Belliella buryatensis]|uniref:RDD family protein n=1 Tax=Belliella buryatensis TaxID=1500549 RepID=A0A239BBR0_9BACT|nr:RDD family protein [Belliella buryatensis]SNS04604.1 RDD family protein [Belliella buryatensis]
MILMDFPSIEKNKMTNYYEILGLSRDASQSEIREAYRKLAFKFHPDKNNGDIYIENLFKKIQRAFIVLSNPEERYNYDISFFGSSQSIKKPEIIFFNSDSIEVGENKKEITFYWDVKNATTIELKPFGNVDSFGKKTIKFNKMNRPSFEVFLNATNSSGTVNQVIQLKNERLKNVDVSRGNIYSTTYSSTGYRSFDSEKKNQNSQPDNLASIGKRVGALFIDALILSVFFNVIFGLSRDENLKALLPIFAVIYFTFFESSKHQATLGKMLFRIKVIDLNGNRLSQLNSLGRSLGRVLSGMTLLIGYIMAIFRDDNKTLHDIIAETFVVEAR